MAEGRDEQGQFTEGSEEASKAGQRGAEHQPKEAKQEGGEIGGSKSRRGSENEM